MSEGGPHERKPVRTVSLDVAPFWLMPVDVLCRCAICLRPPSPGADPLAKILRILAQKVIDHGADGKGVKPWPDALTHAQAAERAVTFLDLADLLDGLDQRNLPKDAE